MKSVALMKSLQTKMISTSAKGSGRPDTVSSGRRGLSLRRMTLPCPSGGELLVRWSSLRRALVTLGTLAAVPWDH